MKTTDNIPDILREAGKELPFRIPDRYFDDFQARLQARLENEIKVSPERKITHIRYLRPAIGLAAACAAIALLVFNPFRGNNGQADLAQMNTASDEMRIINLVEPVDDHTFFNLLENDAQEEKIDKNELEVFIATNYSDYDIYLETQK
jgi:hypothetical protein